MPPQRLPAEVLLALGLAACRAKSVSVSDVETGFSACLGATFNDTGPLEHDSGPCLDVTDSGDSGDTGKSAVSGPTPELIDRLDLPADLAARLRKRCSNQ